MPMETFLSERTDSALQRIGRRTVGASKSRTFADSRAGYADRRQESGDTSLGLAPVPPLAEIAADPQFDPTEVSKEEFESVWNDAVSRSGKAVPHSDKP